MAQVTMYPGMVNSPETVLTRAVDEVATSLYLADATKLPAAPNICTLGLGEDAETVSYSADAVDGVLTVVRGVQGTTRPWAVGTKVSRRIAEMDIAALQSNIDDHESRIGGGTTTAQVTPTAIAIAHETTDAAAGKTGSIDLTANHGQITRMRFYADFTAGQQVAWSGLVNNAAGYDHDDTSVAFDGAIGTLTAGDYVQWGEEICLVGGSGTISTPATLTRGQKGTTATYHPDNEQMVKLNDGIRLEFYPNSDYKPAERIFVWNGIMTGAWTTSAAISSGAQVLFTTDSPAVVSDFGFDDLIIIDPAGTPEIARVAAVFGDVANNSFDKSIFVQGTLGAHDNTKPVYRVAEFDVPIPVKFAGTATTLYIKMFVDEKITGTVTGTLEVIGDKWS
jgi:hypothetical protein